MTDSSHLQLYVDESREKLTELNNALLTLESEGEDREALDMSFRSAHTLKGNSKAMGYDAVGDLAHAVEDLLDGMRDGEIAVTPETMDLAFAGLDEIEAAMAEIADTGAVDRDPEPVMQEIREGMGELTADGVDGAKSDGDGAAGGDAGTGSADGAGAGRTVSADGAADDADSDQSSDGSLPCHRFEVGIEMGPIPGADALLVLEKVEREATIDSTDPERHAVENGEYDGGFAVIVRTDEPEAVADVIRNERAVTDVSVTEDVDGTGAVGADAADASAEAADATESTPADDGESEPSAAEAVGASDEAASEPDVDEAASDLDESVSAPDADEPASAPDVDEAASKPGRVGRFTRGVRASVRSTVAAVRSLPQVTAGLLTSAGAETSPGRPAETEAPSVEGGGAPDGQSVDEAAETSAEVDAGSSVEVDAGSPADEVAETSATEAAGSPADEAAETSAEEVEDSEAADDPTAEVPSDDDLSGDDPSVDDSADGDSGSGDGSGSDAGSGSGDGDDSADDSDDASGSSSGSGVSSVRIDVDRLDELYGIVEQLYTNRIRLRRIVEAAGVDEASEQLDALDKNTTQLQDAVMDMRLVPLSRVLDRFPRTVRDLARDQGKEIDLVIEGDGVEVDRVVLDEISDPLMHLVRNAVDHGLETPAEREAAGKAPEGTLAVRGRRERDQVVIEVEDDGNGLDADDLRDKAVDEGVHTREEVESLSDQEAYELIFHSGFSTADEVTEVSGRGVGMDVVRQRVTELDGSVSIDSELGAGTTVTLRLPVTVAIVEVLFVDVGDDTYGIPIKEIDRVSRDEGIQTVNGRRSIEYEDTIFPVIDLNEFFEGETPDPDADRRLVRIHPDRRKVAILCDAVHDHEEVVVKPLAGPVANTPGLSGTTVLGDGDVVPIVDVQSIGG